MNLKSKYFSYIKDKKYSSFEIINNKFIYIISQDELLLTKIKITINEEGQDTFEKIFEYRIQFQMIISQKNKNNNGNANIPNNFKLSSNFLIINDLLIFGVDNELIINNLHTNESENIRFQKKITKIIRINDDSICVGDSAGKIHFIQDITNKNYILYTKHWHSHGITDLSLDPNNDYLYSCGQEGVVVIWNIHTWVKSFLPRLGEPILSMGVSNDSQNLICYLKN
jgi:WD40 repeat protein